MKCKVCGKNAESDYCFQHKPRKALKKAARARDHMIFTSRENADMLDKVLTRQYFFTSIWGRRPHKSEISGKYLGKEAMSTYFHHILPKNKYPGLDLKEDNIILLTPEEHENVENDMYRYPEVNKRRKQLIIKYEL